MEFPQPKTTLVQYNESLWAIDQEMVRAFLILGREKAMLLDTGASPCGLPALVRTVTELPLVVVNTHGDGDHTANNACFPEVYIHPGDEPLLHRFQDTVSYTVRPVSDGQVFDLGGRTLEVIAIPGHTPGSICLLDRANRMLFAGDTVQRDSVLLFGSNRQPEQYPVAMQKLQGMIDAFDTVWPCHGPCPVEPEAIEGLQKCYEAAVAGKLTPQDPPRPMHEESKLYALVEYSILL